MICWLAAVLPPLVRLDAASDLSVPIPCSWSNELHFLFRKHTLLVLHDPTLYPGRAFLTVLLEVCFFAVIYIKSRSLTQDQARRSLPGSIALTAFGSSRSAAVSFSSC